MSVTNVCFCKLDERFGLVREFKHGKLLVTFDSGDEWVEPARLTFL